MIASTVALLETPDYQQIKQNFLAELTFASQNQPSSLSFMKNLLPNKPLITEGIVQGIVIGGTNYILSTEEIKAKGERTILDRKTGILPTFTDRQSLSHFLLEHIDQRADAIGLNFGFPILPVTGSHGQLDGKIIHGTKEHTFTGANDPLGEMIQALFLQRYHKNIPVSVANDTVCLLLSGVGTEQGSLIAGTGINIGLRLDRSEQNTIVNLEIGNFDKFELSPILKRIDAESEKPGEQLFEKVTSGKYLSLYFNEKIKELGITMLPFETSQELSALSLVETPSPSSELAREILMRSAYLVATAIATVYEFAKQPSKFSIIGEGSMLWNGWQYQEHMKQQFTALGIPAEAIEIKHVQDSSINGAIGLVTK